MTSGQVINKRNGYALCLIIAILLISMIGIAVGSIAKGEERNLEKVAYPTSFKLSQSDTTYSFSELTYIMKDKDKQHYFVMEPEYYYYHWAEIIMTINYPEREDPLVYWDGKDEWDIIRNYIHLYEDSALTKEMKIGGNEFATLRYWFDDNNTVLSFGLGSILDLLDEHGDSQAYYIVIDPYVTATTEHEGSAIIIEFQFKDTEYTTTRKSHSTTTSTTEWTGGTRTTGVYGEERDPVSRGIHINQPSKYRTSTTIYQKTYPDGLNSDSSGWGYYKNNEVDTSYTGFAENVYGTWRVENGYVNFKTSGLFKDDGETYYVRDGKVVTSYTGLATGTDGEYYIKNGKVDAGNNGEVTIYGMIYTLKNGKVVSSRYASGESTPQKTEEPSTKKSEEPTTKKNEPKPATTLNGLVQGPDGKWAMYKNGAVDKSATGIFQNKYGWWRVEKGYVNFNAQGIYQNAYGWWKTTNGKVTFKETGVFQNQFGWWRVKDSKVDFNANGIYQNKYGWWKTKNGKVDFSFTGIAKNEYGTWYVKGGKVDFSKNGNVTYNGKTYTVSNGKVK